MVRFDQRLIHAGRRVVHAVLGFSELSVRIDVSHRPDAYPCKQGGVVQRVLEFSELSTRRSSMRAGRGVVQGVLGSLNSSSESMFRLG